MHRAKYLKLTTTVCFMQKESSGGRSNSKTHVHLFMLKEETWASIGRSNSIYFFFCLACVYLKSIFVLTG